MKKGLKITLKIIGVLVLLLVIIGSVGYFYISATFLSFEDDYTENRNLKELTIDNQTFTDRNGNGKLDIYEDDRRTIDERVDDVFSQMTVEEKIHLLKGSGMASALGKIKPEDGGIPGVVGTIVPTPRLGIPAINLSDGPAGLRIEPIRENEDRTFYTTAFPIGTLLASTWNVDLVEEVGDAMGNEALEYGIDVILGPGVNIHRHPFCGRNFEYYSEDPILTGNIGAAMVNGIQSNGVGTAVKHFVANNQETKRNKNDVRVSERALREIYLKGFKIIVDKSDPWTIMSSYNKVNGEHVAESKELLTNVLRNEWGFKGLVMSDWFGGVNSPEMISAGNDLIEPGSKRRWKSLIKAHEEGVLSIERIDISVKRILKLIFKSKKMQHYTFNENPDLKLHAKITRESATEGIVLLKNNSTLPMKKKGNVALLGIRSYDFISGGGGSGDVQEAYSVSLAEGLVNAGYTINESAQLAFDSYKAANIESFVKKEPLENMMNPQVLAEMPYTDQQLERIVASSDIGIITIGRNSSEGGDRVVQDDFLLSNVEKEILEKTSALYHKANKKVIVVLNVGGVIETTSWKSQTDAILLAWQGGQEGGNAVADILTGKVNPSGKLPMTFPIHLKDHASNSNFPLDGVPTEFLDMIFPSEETPEEEKIKNQDFTNYEEGIYVGYRHFDKTNLDVSYPFGYGLSYTNFEFSDVLVAQENDSLHISISIKNGGKMAGKEVVQVYVSKKNSQIDRPINELKAFVKTAQLQPEALENLSFSIPISELAYWNEKKAKWVVENGDYIINIGSSSRNFSVSTQINIGVN